MNWSILNFQLIFDGLSNRIFKSRKNYIVLDIFTLVISANNTPKRFFNIKNYIQFLFLELFLIGTCNEIKFVKHVESIKAYLIPHFSQNHFK